MPDPLLDSSGKVLLFASSCSLLAYKLSTGETLAEMFTEQVIQNILLTPAGEVVTVGNELLRWDLQAGTSVKLSGPTKCKHGQYVESIQGLVAYGHDPHYGGSDELYLFDAAGQAKMLQGPTAGIKGALYVQSMQGLVTYGGNGELYLFDAAGQAKRLQGPAEHIQGALYVQSMQGLVTYGLDGEIYLFDAAGQAKRLQGPTQHIQGALYVQSMQGLVTYGRNGEIYLFDAAGQAKRLQGPTMSIKGALPSMQGLFTYSDGGECYLFGAAGQAKRLQGPTQRIEGALYVQSMQCFVTYGGCGELYFCDAAGQAKSLQGPIRRIRGVLSVQSMQGFVTYGDASELYLFDAAGQAKRLQGPTKDILGALYVQSMQSLVTYGADNELYLFDAAGQAKRLQGPTHGIKGALYVQSLQGFVTYSVDGELYLFDAAGQAKCLQGPIQGPIRRILGVLSVQSMQGFVTYGDAGELYIFDAAGQAKRLQGPTHGIDGALYVQSLQGFATYGGCGELYLFDAAGQAKSLQGPTESIVDVVAFQHGIAVLCTLPTANSSKVYFYAFTGECMKMHFGMPVQLLRTWPISIPSLTSRLFGTAQNEELLIGTGVGAKHMTLVNVSYCHKGFIASRPLSKAFSSKILDMPAKYAMEVSIASFLAQAVFITITLGQILGSAYNKVKPPAALTIAAKAFAQLQYLGLDPKNWGMDIVDANAVAFGLGQVLVACMFLVFVLQELLEWRKFYEPTDPKWPLLFDAAGAFLTICAGPLFLPLLQIVLLPIQEIAGSASATSFSPVYVVLSGVSACILILYSVRFIKVDKQLGRISATGWGMISWRRDRPPSLEERDYARRHPLSPMQPKHDLVKTVVKTLLSMTQTTCTPVVGASLSLCFGVAMLINDMTLDEFHADARVDYNGVVSALSGGVCWNFLAALLASIADHQGCLDAAQPCLFAVNLLSIPFAVLIFFLRKKKMDFLLFLCEKKVNSKGSVTPEENIRGLQEPLLQ